MGAVREKSFARSAGGQGLAPVAGLPSLEALLYRDRPSVRMMVHQASLERLEKPFYGA